MEDINIIFLMKIPKNKGGNRMAYTEKDVMRIQEILNEIENRKEHSNAAATYKDIPLLQELDRIEKKELNHVQSCDCQALVDSIFIVRYLARAYESMWRIKYANQYYKELLELHTILKQRYLVVDKDIADDYYQALRARNYYGKDNCLDLVEFAKELLPKIKREDIEKQIREDFHPLKHDPVELTDAYLAVIDEVERILDTPENKKLHPFIRNERLQLLLKEYGIDWEPITVLNPGWHFD